MKNKNMDKYDTTLKNVKTRIEIDILSGYQFCVPGETEIARRDIKGYCSQHNDKYPGVAPCIDCSLSNYGRDCHNLEIVDFLNK